MMTKRIVTVVAGALLMLGSSAAFAAPAAPPTGCPAWGPAVALDAHVFQGVDDILQWFESPRDAVEFYLPVVCG